jgi:hypothetical protein
MLFRNGAAVETADGKEIGHQTQDGEVQLAVPAGVLEALEPYQT